MNPGITQPDLRETKQANGTHPPMHGLPGTSAEKAIIPPPGYELLEEVGRGGMGVVYRARDVSFDREVALKFLQPQYESHSQQALRFMDEAHITGQLQHPGIPAVHQVGKLPDGKPYLVMKLIRGYTLSNIIWPKETGVSETNTSVPHTIPAQYLSIFEAICQAMGYAHAHQVIHRDLKPDNIMVGAFGEVQVMDWGLAKVLHGHDNSTIMEVPANDPELTIQYHDESQIHTSGSQLTTAGSVLGTPAYMAPEQALGANALVDARADVFGLGAILCCLLTGKPPFVGDHPESTRLLAAMGLLNDTYDRLDASGAEPDLISLAKRCLAIKPEDRPENGEAVAREVAGLRSAADERVKQAELECTKATIYVEEQKKKRRLLLLAGVAIVTVLVVGIIGTTWGLIRANAKSNEALRKESELEKVLAFVNDKVFSAPRPYGLDQGLGKDVTLKEVLENAIKSIEHDFADQPIIEASLRLTLGKSFEHLGEFQKALKESQRALDLRKEHLGLEDRDTIQALLAVANVQEKLEWDQEALDARVLAYQISKQYFGLGDHTTQMSMNNLAGSYEKFGRGEEALVLREQVLKLTQEYRGKTDAFTMLSMNNLAVIYSERGRYQDALTLLEEAIELQKKHLGETHPNTMDTIGSYAECLASMKQYQKAMDLFEKVLEVRQKKLGLHHPDTLQAMIDVSNMWNCLGNQKKALEVVELALPLFEEQYDKKHGETLYCLSIIISRLLDLRQMQEARTWLDDSYQRTSELPGKSKLLSVVFALKVRYFLMQHDLKACQNTLLEWGNRHPSGGDNFIEFAASWSMVAQLKKEIDKTGTEESDKAILYLQQAVKAKWKRVIQLETDARFDYLRDRDDFKKLVNELKEQMKKKPDPISSQ